MNEFLLGAITSAVAMSLGQALLFIAQVIFYKYGSSAGSRAKDSVIAKQLPGPVSTPLPAPVPKSPAPTPTVPTTTVTGKMSTFGGPNDMGVSPSEGLALCEPSEMHMFPGIFLPAQPPGTTGLARRLDPSSYYIAMRWDYNQTPRSFLQKSQVQVSANGKALMARPVDWGPNADTGRVADLSPGLATALGLATDNVVTVLMPLPSGAPAPMATAAPTLTSSSEPAWLTWARGEIGFHETGDNQGIGKYITLSHCGAEGDPWCAIFANAALEVSGIPGTRSPAAQSFCTDPKFTKLDGFRLGAIVVFWRGQRSSGLGHVGFAVSEDASRVQVLGGNENDSVMIEGMPKNGSTMGLLGYWWPVNATPEPKVT